MSEHFDVGSVADCRAQPTVPGNQRGFEALRQGDVDRIVSSEIVPKLPDSRQEYEMGIARNWQVDEINRTFFGAAGFDRVFPYQAPQHLRDFNVEQVRGVQRLTASIDALLNVHPRRSL